jgi:hypothetical protein
MLLLGIVALLVVGFILARPLTSAKASVSPSNDQAPNNQAAVAGIYDWSFAAKFVCGFQTHVQPPAGALPGEPIVKPGNYATEINIHNPNFRPASLKKRVIVLVDGDAVHAEPVSVGPAGGAVMELPGDFATLDDCNTLWTLAHPNSPVIPTPMPLFIGYLVILTPLDLNVNTVFTTNAPGDLGSSPSSNSIDVLTVAGKRIFIPFNVNP